MDDVKSLINSDYDKINAIYDTVRQFIASKKYFEKYINYKCDSFIIYDNFIKIDYFFIENDK